MQGRPRRSVLYMPGSNERALEKAKTIPADALIFDLEDAVAPDAKPRRFSVGNDEVHLSCARGLAVSVNPSSLSMVMGRSRTRTPVA